MENAVKTPQIVIWYKVYAALMGLLYLFVVGLGILYTFLPNWIEDDPRMGENEALLISVIGVFLIFIGLILSVLFFFTLFKKPAPWLWTFDLVLICLGLTSACCMIVSVPLLIFWLKEETKNYFGIVKNN